MPIIACFFGISIYMDLDDLASPMATPSLLITQGPVRSRTGSAWPG